MQRKKSSFGGLNDLMETSTGSGLLGDGWHADEDVEEEKQVCKNVKGICTTLKEFEHACITIIFAHV